MNSNQCSIIVLFCFKINAVVQCEIENMTYVVIFSDRKGWSRNMSVINLHWSKFRVHITDNLNDSVSHYWFWVKHPCSTRSLRWGSVCLPRNMSVNNLQWSEIRGHIMESGVFLLGFHGFELGVLGHFTDICETRLKYLSFGERPLSKSKSKSKSALLSIITNAQDE